MKTTSNRFSRDINNEDKIIRRKILSMILPITVESVLQMTNGIISMAMIGRIDSVAVSALGISNNIFNIIWELFKGISTGVSVLVAQAYGANNYNKLRKVATQTLFISIILVMILQQILFWNTENILKFFNPSEELLSSAAMHLKITTWGLPFITVVLLVGGVFQGMGNAKTPMKVAIIMNLVNIIFSNILIFGRFGINPMGLKGAAYAILIAQFIAAVIGLIALFGKQGPLRLEERQSLRIELSEVLPAYRVGIPVSCERIFWQVASIILTKAILTYGEISYAAYQLGLQAESISYMPGAGFGVAATTFIGYSIGARDMNQGRKYLKQLTKWGIMLTIFTGGLLIFFPKQIMRILTNDMDIIKIAAVYLFVMGLVQFPQNLKGVVEGALRGAGFSKTPTIISMFGLWGVRVPLSLLGTYVFDFDITFIWIVFGIDLIFRFVTDLIVFKKKDIFNNARTLV